MGLRAVVSGASVAPTEEAVKLAPTALIRTLAEAPDFMAMGRTTTMTHNMD